MHDQRLPNRSCAQCSTRFFSSHEKKYCSDECLEAAAPYAGEKNANFQGKREHTTCESCGEGFTYYPSEKPGLYCSQCVEAGGWRTVPGLEGEDSPRWKGGKVDVECEICGESIERFPSEITSEVTVCSEDCQAKWLSAAFEGEGHPNWAGGPSSSYGTGWNRVRTEALQRDGYACQICGKDKAAIGRNPDVHHIVPVRWFRNEDGFEERDAHTLENVVSLCVSCHRRADHGRISREALYGAAGIAEPAVDPAEE
ncbi:MAG: HNH endonuclease [Halobacteriaceae archaeon]